MDLIRLLRSLEEFLYELVGWLVFYPRTLWRVLVRPGDAARYTRQELAKAPEQRFSDGISPVLMLILSVVLAHAIEMALRISAPEVTQPVGKLLLGSEQGLLLTRSAVFCIYALGAALSTLWRQGARVDRDTLREPFSIQAFIACPFVLMLSLSQASRAWSTGWAFVGPAIGLVAVAWYLWARTRTFVELNGGGHLRAFGFVLTSFLVTTVVVVSLFAAMIL